MSSAGNDFPRAAQDALLCLALTACVFVAYSNVYDNAMLFDDNLLIASNDYLKGWSHFWTLITSPTQAGVHVAGGFYRPLQMALYFLIYRIGGTEPFGYHLLNVVIHAANACMIFLLGRRFKFNPWAVFSAAVIWALHPLHTEAVTYISGTADLLGAFFCLLGVFVAAPDFMPRKIGLSVPIFLLALAGKESAVVFPALVTISIFLKSEKRLSPGAYFRTWPLWLIALGFSYWRMKAPGFDGPQSYNQFYAQHNYDTLQLYAAHFSWRLYTFFATIPAYLKLLVWPTGLHMERSFMVFDALNAVQVWEGITLIVAAAAQIGWNTRKSAQKNPATGLPLSWGILWFGVAHFPNTGLVFPMNSQFLEHWMYLPSAGLFLGLAQTVSLGVNRVSWKPVKPALLALTFAAAVILGIATFEQNEVWHDPFTFYGNIFKYGEVSPRGHNNLALAYMDKGDYPAAVAEFEKTIKLTDTYAETRYNLALALLSLPDAESEIPDAIADLRRALDIDPHFYRAWEALAGIYDHIGDAKDAAICRRKAVENFVTTK